MQILAILNVTRDSFSDGGRYLEPAPAVAHARQLVADGADLIDVGAESTHPDAEDVPAEEEVRRLTPVVQALRAEHIRVSVDTYKPAVMRTVLALGVEVINDVTALRDPEAVAVLRDHDTRVILMHSTSAGARAERSAATLSPADIVQHIVGFFRRRIAELESAGIARERLILDPGMGLFLGPDPLLSVAMLRNLDRLKSLGLPVCVSTSRKGFIGELLGDATHRRPVGERGAGTLATELWAAHAGADFIRTHDVRALRDGLAIWNAIRTSGGSAC